MNDIKVIQNEELIEKKNPLPVEVEGGGPFGVSEKTSLLKGNKDFKKEFSFGENTEICASVPEMNTLVNNFINDQMHDILKLKWKSPDNPYVANNIGLAYLNSGEVKNAIASFEEALKLKRDFLTARKNLAKAYIIEGNYDSAVKLYKEEEEKCTEDTQVLMGLVHIYIRQGKLDEARKYLNKIIALDPNNASAFHNLGILELSNNNIGKAISYFRKALNINESLVATYNALGVCNLLRNNIRQAIKSFTIALGIDKANPDILKNLAVAYNLVNDYRKSIKLMEDYLSNYPMDRAGHDIIADTYFRNGDYDKSFSNLQFMIENGEHFGLSNYDKARLYNNLGANLRYMKNNDYAINALNKSIELCDKKFMFIPYSNLISIYLSQNKTDNAEMLIKKYLDNEHDNYLPVDILAEYYYHIDNWARAKELAGLVQEKDHNDISALSVLSSICNEIFEDKEKALELAKRAFEIVPSNKVLINNLAYAYLTNGYLEDAKRILDSVKLDKNYFVLYATKGLSKILDGCIGEGANFYDDAARFAPSAEMKKLVEQKKHLEIGKYFVSSGDIQKGVDEFNRVMSIKCISQIFTAQAKRFMDKYNEIQSGN